MGTLSVSLALSLATLLYRTENLSGTGTHVTRGFPRAYYFTWSDNEQPGPVSAGVHWFSFALNWLVWAAAVWVAVRLVRGWRARRRAAV